MAQAAKVEKKHVALALVLISVLTVAFIAAFYLQVLSRVESLPNKRTDFFFGVMAGGNVAETKAVIDKVKEYTNLIAFTNPTITENITSLEEVANYASSNGLSFFVQTTYPSPYSDLNFNPITWASIAKEKYDGRFMGYYLYDEPGGNQVDQGDYVQFDEKSMPCDYRDATNTYVYYLYIQLRDFMGKTNLVTSDYALYWFDYEAGYDTVFCEFGWNSSRALNIAQCRGAAEMHNKTWGAVLTWTYTEFPYMESPSDLYQDMVTAYDAGAKYVLVFNYPQENQYGVLNEQHFDKMKAFWQYAAETPQNGSSNKKKVAYVIPDNYGFGFRGTTEKIWGLWEPDELTPLIWDEANALVEKYGPNFDIIVGSPFTQVFGRFHYDKLIRWNSTAVE